MKFIRAYGISLKKIKLNQSLKNVKTFWIHEFSLISPELSCHEIAEVLFIDQYYKKLAEVPGLARDIFF